MRRFTSMVILSLGLLLSTADGAWAMRCGNQLVAIGDRQYEILQKCGEPVFREEREEERYFRIFREGRFFEVLQEVTVEEWTYNLGPHQFIRILRFENGRLERIEMGGYGY